jgi:hypothetical protein
VSRNAKIRSHNDFMIGPRIRVGRWLRAGLFGYNNGIYHP